MRKKLLLFGTLLMVGIPNFAQNTTDVKALQKKTAEEIINEAPGKAFERLKANRLQEVIKEATNIVSETNKVIELLQERKIEKASVLLERINSKLDKLIKEHGLVKIPVNVTFQVYTFAADLSMAKRLAEVVKKAVNGNDFVKARTILNFLRDEIDIITTYMPLDLYSESLKLATELLKQNKIESVILALESALKTLEIETVIVPRPLLEAQVLLQDAKKIYNTQPKKALEILKRIEQDIKRAQVLGYVPDKKEIKPLLEQIAELKRAVEESLPTAENQFKETSKALNELVNKSIKTAK